MPEPVNVRILKVVPAPVSARTRAESGCTKTWTNGLIQPLDQGDFDNRQLLATLREIGYRGPIGLMCYGIPGDARDHLARSMAAWKQMKAERGKPHPTGRGSP